MRVCVLVSLRILDSVVVLPFPSLTSLPSQTTEELRLGGISEVSSPTLCSEQGQLEGQSWLFRALSRSDEHLQQWWLHSLGGRFGTSGFPCSWGAPTPGAGGTTTHPYSTTAWDRVGRIHLWQQRKA